MSEQPSRICSCQMSLTPQTFLGGGVFHFHCLDALAQQGVPCLIPLSFQPEHVQRKNWDVRSLPIRKTFKMGALVSNLVFFFHLVGLWFFKNERFALLRVSDPYYIGPAALAFAALTGVPTVGYVFHIEPNMPLRNRLIGWICRRLDAVIVTSEFTKRQVNEQFHLANKKIHVTYGGVTRFDSKLTKDQAKRELGFEGKTVLTFLGTLTERKNPEGLIDIFARLAQRASDTVLLVGGREGKDTGMLSRLRSSVQRMDLSDRVVFTEWIDNRKKGDLYRATDLFVFPSKLEGFGLAVVEAMAEGAPAVVSDRGSLPEIVVEGKTGFVRDPDDPQAFAQAIVRLIEDESLREQMGAEAARHVQDKFRWEACAQRTIAVHEAILADRSRHCLGVLLNTGDSLDVMRREGQKDRFVTKYLPRWNRLFPKVLVFSYGNDDKRLNENVVFLPNRKTRWGLVYSLKLPFVYSKTIRSCSLLRVMQTQGALPAVIARVLFGKRFVTTYGYRYGDSMRLKGRYTYGLWLDLLERLVLRMAAAVIVTTPSLQRHVGKRTAAHRIHLLPNGVDTKMFHPVQPGRRQTQRILYVGRCEPHKNLDMVIAALAPVVNIPTELWVVGEGPERRRWEALCIKNGLASRFFGAVPHSALPEIHRDADIFVLPSRFEGHPKALIEAFASGLPCIGARSEGIVEVIEEGKNGLLADVTVSSFGEQLVRLLADKQLQNRLGQAARAHAVEHYDLDHILDREMELLASMMPRRKR